MTLSIMKESPSCCLALEPRLVTLVDHVFVGIIEFPKFCCPGAVGAIANSSLVGTTDISLYLSFILA
jgi:hypothetical protein